MILDKSKFILSGDRLTLYHTIPSFNDPEQDTLENILGKGENAGNQHFLLYPKCFLPYPFYLIKTHHFSYIFFVV